VTPPSSIPGFLLLEDGTLFRGRLAASFADTVAEVVFTTNMTGYQETFSDPSYRGQIVVMTAPMIGNYGINLEDPESARPQVAGVVVRELSRTYSSWRASGDLLTWLSAADVPILEGVDTRQLTKHLRSAGVMRGVIGAGVDASDAARQALEACPSMEGLDLVGRHHGRALPVGADDAGITSSRTISGSSATSCDSSRRDYRVTVVPSTRRPEGRYVQTGSSFNGPGDRPQSPTHLTRSAPAGPCPDIRHLWDIS
jgi:carbamoyl-phosphate synthase small subunit